MVFVRAAQWRFQPQCVIHNEFEQVFGARELIPPVERNVVHALVHILQSRVKRHAVNWFAMDRGENLFA
jgi:hypothetical protein